MTNLTGNEKDEIILTLKKTFPTLDKNGFLQDVFDCVSKYYIFEQTSKKRFLEISFNLIDRFGIKK